MKITSDRHAAYLRARVAFNRERHRLEGSFSAFVQGAWHVLEASRELQWNWHLDTICAHMEAFRRRDLKRLILNVPFRTMKSLLVGVFYPSWVWTTEPAHEFLTLSHGGDLATRDAVKMRDLCESQWYQDRWGSRVSFSVDQNTKQYYKNTAGGHRNAQGLTAGLTGKGGDTILIDDPHDAEKAQSEDVRNAALSAYDRKVSNRLNDPANGGICIIMQRLHVNDLTGHVLQKKGQRWVHLKIPMEYTGKPTFKSAAGKQYDDPRRKVGELLWPKRFPADVVREFKVDLGTYGAAGQLQQEPTPDGGGILKREWWRKWPHEKPPQCDYIIQVYDTGFEEKEENDFSARTTWGIFEYEDPTETGRKGGRARYNAILLDRFEKRVSFPELRREAQTAYNRFRPDRVLVEKKASGHSLLQELRRNKVPVKALKADISKRARAHAASGVLESGAVWYMDRQWAQEVIERCSNATFTDKDHAGLNDIPDTCVYAWLHLRNQFWLQLPDEDDEESDDDEPRKRRLYG